MWTGHNDIAIGGTSAAGAPGNVFHYNVLNFGAVRDSTVDNTANFQRALDSAHVTGGTVYVPAFVWKVGQLHIYSNTYLYGEDQGSIIKTTATSSPPHRSIRWRGGRCCLPPASGWAGCSATAASPPGRSRCNRPTPRRCGKPPPTTPTRPRPGTCGLAGTWAYRRSLPPLRS